MVQEIAADLGNSMQEIATGLVYSMQEISTGLVYADVIQQINMVYNCGSISNSIILCFSSFVSFILYAA